MDVPLFDLSFDVPDIVCNGDTTKIMVNANPDLNLQYMWTGPAGTILSGEDTNMPTIRITESTEFMVTVVDTDSGCEADGSVTVNASSINVEIQADPGTEINQGESVDLEVVTDGDPVAYDWDTGDVSGSGGTVTPDMTTTYTVTVTDVNGCTGTDAITIEVRQAVCDETDVFVPNAFTPNNDGNNDVFRVRSNFIESMRLIVYNRWGQEIFESTSQENGWDGTLQNEELSPDVYGYYLEVICINDVQYNIKGNVSLLR